MAKRAKKRKDLICRLKNVLDSHCLTSTDGIIIAKIQHVDPEAYRGYTIEHWRYDGDKLETTWWSRYTLVDYKNSSLPRLRQIIQLPWRPNRPATGLEALAKIF